MRKKRDIKSYLTILFFILAACRTSERKPQPDRYDEGIINVSADESFKPVIDEQVEVYEVKYPKTKIRVSYKPESDCIRDMGVDSVRMVIITRRFSEEEKNYMVDSMKVSPSQLLLAYDAIAVVVHPESEDDFFTMGGIRNVLTGNFRKNLIPVFDGLKATSTIRFIVDSVLRGQVLTSKALAAPNSEEVINYVAKNKDAVGFIGVSWIGNKDDPQQQSFLKKVKLAHIESEFASGKYFLPVQMNIYDGWYPMRRELFSILKENYPTGLGHGFRNFMTGEQGQLIFRRAYLVPGQLQFNNRSAVIREE